MQKRIAVILVLMAFTSAYARAGSPQVRLSYAEIFDRVCARETKVSVDEKWRTELEIRLPEFQTAWEQSGTELLNTASTVVGKKFSEGEFSVALTLCSFPSMSNPLLINMRYALASFTEQPIPLDVTVSTIFHEILHRYLNDKIPEHSKLLKKYSTESETVLSHLHLFALQKAVYLKLKQEDLLQKVITKDRTLPNGSYKRAWEIVNDLEDYHSFIQELQ